MKTSIRSAVLCGVLLAAATAAPASAVMEGTIAGSGRLQTESREVGSFTSVELDGSGEVILSQGARQSLVVEADDNVLPVIATEVRGNVLHLGFRPGTRLSHVTRIRFTVTAPVIAGITISGSGDVRSATPIRGDSLALSILGSGSMHVEADVERLTEHIAGSGSMTVQGAATEEIVSIDGSGSVRARDVASSSASVRIGGSGNASVTSSRSLSIKLTGSGDVEYGGGAAPNISSSGSGSVRPY